MGDLKLTRHTTAQIREKPPPSSIYYTLHLFVRPSSKWLFVLGLPNGSPEITNIRTPVILESHNFVCRPPIETRSESKI
jgi:hypothetical protein